MAENFVNNLRFTNNDNNFKNDRECIKLLEMNLIWIIDKNTIRCCEEGEMFNMYMKSNNMESSQIYFCISTLKKLQVRSTAEEKKSLTNWEGPVG